MFCTFYFQKNIYVDSFLNVLTPFHSYIENKKKIQFKKSQIQDIYAENEGYIRERTK